MAHTPTPWFRLTGGFMSNTVSADWCDPRHYVGEFKCSDEDFEFIRLAVNCHDALLAACKKMLTWAIQEESRVYHEPIPDEQMSDDLRADVDAARAVIAKAERTP